MEADDGSSDFVFQTNIYYGIHYPAAEIEYVCKALAGTKFNDLATDEREITFGEHQFLRNVNSDASETRGIIFPDDMSIQGEESPIPITFCKFDPAELVESETTYANCVEITTDIYDIIIAHYKKIGRSTKHIYLGWYVYNCEWCEDSDSDSEDSSVKSKVPASAKPSKVAAVPASAKNSKPPASKPGQGAPRNRKK